MDELETYRRLIESILTEHTRIPYAYGEIRSEVVFDREHDRYLVMNVGWDQGRRVHGSLIHLDVIDGKIWVQRDGTEDGVATELLAGGVPKDRIVLAFHSLAMRQYTDFAVA